MFTWLRGVWPTIMLLLGVSSGMVTRDWCAASILMVLALIGVLDGLVIRAISRIERPSMPQCQACGYNLTGNLSGICPECGARIRLPDDGGRGVHST